MMHYPHGYLLCSYLLSLDYKIKKNKYYSLLTNTYHKETLTIYRLVNSTKQIKLGISKGKQQIFTLYLQHTSMVNKGS